MEGRRKRLNPLAWPVFSSFYLRQSKGDLLEEREANRRRLFRLVLLNRRSRSSLRSELTAGGNFRVFEQTAFEMPFFVLSIGLQSTAGDRIVLCPAEARRLFRFLKWTDE
ncbi:hypothetical protein M3Y99_01553600 [Aphelenchoides fujianensis]|nr:hypothetical protein M3Y99_01553600 [Aphelenchoides fujianensis]